MLCSFFLFFLIQQNFILQSSSAGFLKLVKPNSPQDLNYQEKKKDVMISETDFKAYKRS